MSIKHSLIAAALTMFAGQSALAQDSQSKDEWRTKMLSEERVEKKRCSDKSYLVVCTTEFTNPETKEKTKLTTDTCREAIKEVVEASLSTGNPKGILHGKLPANLSVNAMTQYGNMLGDMAGETIVEAVKKNRGNVVNKPKCLLKRQAAFSVKGN